MKRLLVVSFLIAFAGCHEKEEAINLGSAIEGSWYGSVGKNPMNGDNQYIRLDLHRGEAEISTYFIRYDNGWHDATGEYHINNEEKILFNVDMGECEVDNSRIIVTYARVGYSYTTGKKEMIIALHYDRYSDYYKETTSECVWLSRERPDF